VSLIAVPQPTEDPKGLRIGQVELQRPVAEAVRLLDQQRAQHLLGTHAVTACRARGAESGARVLKDQLVDPRMPIQDLRYDP
jgi:hypothetical protein